MPEFKFYKTFEADGIPDGGTYEKEWNAEGDLIIRRIHIKDKSGAELNKSTFWLKIVDRTYTRPKVFASVLGPDKLVSPILDIPFSDKEKLNFTFKNLEGAAIDVYITFETHKR